MTYPHDNVAHYLGCVVKAGRITGLCFRKYEETLLDRLKDGRSVDVESCLQQVKAGINHLHQLDLVHNDIHSNNVMFTGRESNTLVVIDFDSCVSRGHRLLEKYGETPEGACTAEFENDSFALDKLLEELNSVKEA